MQEGSTPLHIAASTEGSENIIKNLIEDGAQINSTDGSGKYVKYLFFVMLCSSHVMLIYAKLLLETFVFPPTCHMTS